MKREKGLIMRERGGSSMCVCVRETDRQTDRKTETDKQRQRQISSQTEIE